MKYSKLTAYKVACDLHVTAQSSHTEQSTVHHSDVYVRCARMIYFDEFEMICFYFETFVCEYATTEQHRVYQMLQ